MCFRYFLAVGFVEKRVRKVLSEFWCTYVEMAGSCSTLTMLILFCSPSGNLPLYHSVTNPNPRFTVAFVTDFSMYNVLAVVLIFSLIISIIAGKPFGVMVFRKAYVYLV